MLKKQSKYRVLQKMLALVMIAALFSVTVFSAELFAAVFVTKSPLHVVFEQKAESIELSGQNLTVNTVKEVKDFSGRIYIVVECAPTGYMIYSTETGVFVESSPTSYSPYLNFSGDNLYYGGPTEYYRLVNGTYLHTILPETITQATDVDRMENLSDSISERLQTVKDVALLDYVLNENSSAYALSQRAVPLSVTGGGLSAEEISWFQGLTSCGYYEGPASDGSTYGCCGFVGLNIIYAFFDKFIDDIYMDNQYWANSAKTSLKNGNDSFTKYLHDLDPKETTTSVHINSVSNQYLDEKNISGIDHTNRIWGLFTSGTIKGILDNGYPVELFGSLADPPGYDGEGKKSGHAVVAYQYIEDSGTQYVCHYGWNGYSNVTIQGTLGSIYAMELE